MGRRVPFSGKQKKVQLKLRKIRKADKHGESSNGDQNDNNSDAGSSSSTVVVGELAANRLAGYTSRTVSINQQPSDNGRGNKYNLQFCRAKLDAEYEKSKKEMLEHVEVADPTSLEYSSEYFFPEGLCFPERPEGYQSMTPATLDQLENKSVRLFHEHIMRTSSDGDINLFEQNVETWRQLWRVMDKSDVLLFITDARFAVCQFPPSVYRRLQSHGRGVVLVLNKVDLVPAALVLAWLRYFEDLCPGVQVVPFCSHESVEEKRRKSKMALNSCRALIVGIEQASSTPVDLSSWRRQLEREAEYGDELEDSSEESGDSAPVDQIDVLEAGCSSRAASRPFTIGTIGYPNVGKSSLINAIMGKYKVGVSQTPGYTKHFQTHYLTPSKDIMLCDCPGLVFPALCPYKLQVLSGSFPISQVRAPMAVVGFLATHINVPRALGLKPPAPDYDDEFALPSKPKWKPYTIAEGWAEKRSYRNKGGRLDTSRAANELLRMSLNAKNKLVLCLMPPQYHRNKHEYERSAEVATIKLIQGVHAAEVEVQEKVLSFEVFSRQKSKTGQQLAQPSSPQKLSHRNKNADRFNVINKFAALRLIEDSSDIGEDGTDTDNDTDDDLL